MAAKGALIALRVDVFAAGAFKATSRPPLHPQTDQIFATCAGKSMSRIGHGAGWFGEFLIHRIPEENTFTPDAIPT
jgi:hypothetical protein